MSSCFSWLKKARGDGGERSTQISDSECICFPDPRGSPGSSGRVDSGRLVYSADLLDFSPQDPPGWGASPPPDYAKAHVPEPQPVRFAMFDIRGNIVGHVETQGANPDFHKAANDLLRSPNEEEEWHPQSVMFQNRTSRNIETYIVGASQTLHQIICTYKRHGARDAAGGVRFNVTKK